MHLIVDNYATHKHPKVRAWRGRHPRFHFHFTPTSASWLNAVEGFFAKLTRRRLKRGVFHVWYPRPAAARMRSGSAVQTNGFGLLWSARERLIAAWRSTSEC